MIVTTTMQTQKLVKEQEYTQVKVPAVVSSLEKV